MKKVILSLMLVALSLCGFSQLSVAPNQTATNLANYLLGGGVTITNAQLTCPTNANAIFTNGATTNLGLNSGIVLTTGSAANIANGNGTNSSVNNGASGIPQMAPISGTSSNYDGCMLEFDINPKCSPLNIRYKFASEEYPEYVGAGYNDAFGFFITGPNPSGGNYANYNLAVVPGTSSPVTIDNINSGNNSSYYITNTGSTIVYDGMTTVLTGSANVTPCADYHLRLAITDGGDQYFDSGVFLEQSGISCSSPTVNASGATICAGQSATLTASGTTTYTWSTGSTANSIVVSPSSTTSYTVGGSNIGICVQTSKVITVTVNNAPTAVAGPTKVLTCATTATVLSGSGGGTYAWSGPGILSGGSTASPTVNQPGNYTLVVTSAGCPSLPSVVNVSQNTTPPSVSSSAGALTCAVTSANVTANTAATPVTYNWSGPGITGGGTTSSPTVNQPGTYNYTVTNTSNGCATTGSQAITQNIVAPVATSSVTAVLNCTLTTVNTVATTTTTPVTYNWSGTGITGGSTTSSPTVNQPGTFNYTITSTSNGCTTTGSQAVTQNIVQPTVASSAPTVLNCTLTSVNATASTTTTPVTYNWSGPGVVSGGTTPTVTVNQPGTYNYTVTATNGCQRIGSQAVTQNIVAPTVASSAGVLNCTLTSVNAIASTTTTPVTYNWGGPGITGGATTATITANQPGTYNYTVTANNGCTKTGTQAITQNTATPSVTMPATQTITCAAPSVTLVSSASPSTSIPVWTGGVSSGVNSYTATASSANTYTLTITDPANGCTKTGIVQVVPNAGFPTVLASNTNSLNCNVTSAQVVATTSTTPVSYSWTGPGITGGATTATASVNAGGQYTVVVMNTISLCSSTITIAVPFNTTVPTPSITASGSITCTSPTVALNGFPTTGVTYTWTGSGITTGPNLQNVIVNAGGNYVLNVTNISNGCTGTQNISVATNTTAPSVNLTTTSYTTTCAVPNATFSAVANPAASTTYSWTSPPTGSLNSYTVSNPIASGSGIFTVAVTNTVNGCGTSAITQGTVQITADAGLPSATISQSSASLTCITSVQTASVFTTPSSNITYTWSPAPATGLHASVATFTTPGTYVCAFTNTANACPGSTQIVIVTNTTTPTANVTPTVSLNCYSVTSTISSTVTPASGITYTWAGSGIAGANNGSSVSVNSAGVYTLSVLNAANGCSATATSSVINNTTPPTLSVTPSSTVITCGSPTLNLNATTNSTVIPVWNTPTGNAYNPIVAVTAGNYTVSVIDPVSGCTASLTLAVAGSTVAPALSVTANAIIPCGSSSIDLSAAATGGGITYNWAGPTSGSIIAGANTATPIATAAGVYTVTITNSYGCTSSATVAVAQSSVNAAFTADPTTGVIPLNVNTTNQSTGGSLTYQWNFGNGSTSTNVSPGTVYNTSGTYTIVLIASSGSCADTATAIIVVEDNMSLEIPNVFTPNNDGTNDIFTIKSTGIKEISLQIFNRWGEKLYEFTGTKAAWDGMTPQGAKVPDATYFYFVKAYGFDDKEIEKHGTVNLFR
ncbi:MAG: choice-of-anchor L domain-containing protein [Bacteroidota bacterium]